jgi:hypothetical protein
MKTRLLFSIALVTFACAPLMAQQADASAQQNASGSAGGAHFHDSANTSGQASTSNARVGGSAADSVTDSAANGSISGASESGEAMSPISAELVGKLDSKSAKVGDRVVAKTTKTVQTADGTVIPKGTRLVGHVTSVEAHGKANADSALSLAFDQAELKNGARIPIRSEIRSVAPSAAAIEAASMQDDDLFAGGGGMGGGMMAGGRAVGAARAGGGGLIGGSLHQASYVTNSARMGAEHMGTMTDATAHSVGHATHGAAGLAEGVRASGATTGGAAARAMAYPTGIRGVMLAGDATGRSAGTLSASKQNIHLDNGTQMVLGVAREQ